MSRDNIFTQPIAGDFQFNDQVAEVFPDMINRSVPCYDAIIKNLPIIGRRYIKNQTNVYDLGCSLGAVTFQLRQHISNLAHLEQVNFIAVDNSQAMINRAQLKLEAYHSQFPTEFILSDITDVTITNASLVVLNFVLQFLKPTDRVEQLQRIYAGLNPGGVLVLSEKYHHDDEFLDQELTELHLDFKKANGYSELEVQRKRTALENVMIIDSMQTHLDRLKAVGFSKVVVWQLGYNFCSFLAFK